MRFDISVVIPTLQQNSKELERAINSCLDHHCAVQVVVVDDSGKPSPLQGRLPSVIWVRPSKHTTLANALNLGHRAGQGEYHFTMDDTDVLTPFALDNCFL